MKSIANSKRELVLAGIVRPDNSSAELQRYSDEYTQVIFVANPGADADCQALDGMVYNIDDLLGYDNPLYRTSHPNCSCQFVPYEESRILGEENEELTGI